MLPPIPPTPKPNSRKDLRHRLRFPVTLGRMTLFTVNLGRGGLCIEAMRVLESGTPVEGAIRVRGAEHRYVGRVAWSRPGSPRLSVRGRMGVAFVALAPEVLGVIAALAAGAPAVPPPLPERKAG